MDPDRRLLREKYHGQNIYLYRAGPQNQRQFLTTKFASGIVLSPPCFEAPGPGSPDRPGRPTRATVNQIPPASLRQSRRAFIDMFQLGGSRVRTYTLLNVLPRHFATCAIPLFCESDVRYYVALTICVNCHR